MATLAGMVHGVVVQIRPYTVRPASAGSIAAGSDCNAKRTQIDGLAWFSYSTSASASAVRQWMHQCTGFSPLYTEPCARKSTKARAMIASYSALIVRYGSSQRPKTPSRWKLSLWSRTYLAA